MLVVPLLHFNWLGIMRQTCKTAQSAITAAHVEGARKRARDEMWRLPTTLDARFGVMFEIYSRWRDVFYFGFLNEWSDVLVCLHDGEVYFGTGRHDVTQPQFADILKVHRGDAAQINHSVMMDFWSECEPNSLMFSFDIKKRHAQEAHSYNFSMHRVPLPDLPERKKTPFYMMFEEMRADRIKSDAAHALERLASVRDFF